MAEPIKSPPKDTLNISWPRMMPDGAPITKVGMKAAWKEIITPMQEGAALTGEMSNELRTLMALFRHVYSEMPDEE
jgi:hypothetical protein